MRRRVAGGEVPFIPGGGSPSLSANESPLPDTTSPTYLILLTSLHMLPSVITITGLHQHFIDAEFPLLGSPDVGVPRIADHHLPIECTHVEHTLNTH